MLLKKPKTTVWNWLKRSLTAGTLACGLHEHGRRDRGHAGKPDVVHWDDRVSIMRRRQVGL